MADEAPRRVLLVEDNEVNQALAIAILTKLGCHADLADNGQQAVEQVTRGRCGLVLMDCQLPVPDSHQATAEIRRREGTTRHTPIVAMTAGVLEDRSWSASWTGSPSALPTCTRPSTRRMSHG